MDDDQYRSSPVSALNASPATRPESLPADAPSQNVSLEELGTAVRPSTDADSTDSGPNDARWGTAVELTPAASQPTEAPPIVTGTASSTDALTPAVPPTMPLSSSDLGSFGLSQPGPVPEQRSPLADEPESPLDVAGRTAAAPPATFVAPAAVVGGGVAAGLVAPASALNPDHGPGPLLELPTASSSASDSTGIPAKIGRFKVVRLLGKGGFGEVYLGRDPTLPRYVALKIPRIRATSANAESEFVEEALKLVNVQGPGIVVVYEVYPAMIDGQPRVCIVQQFIDGHNLAEWHAAQPKPIDPDRIAQLVADIATIVGSIHRQGVIHCDLKPANIMIDKAGRPYVLDFGLAMHDDQRMTRSGSVAGTWPYMSPEQICRQTHNMDGRSDIWSLGVILYELFSGRRPFNGSNTYELTEAVRKIDPLPLRQLLPDFPATLDLICQKCLQKLRNDRYMAMAELAIDLRGWSKKSLAKPSTTAPDSRLSSKPLRVIPRGLRPFTEEDSGFFLELLPGVRAPNGLPDSIDFWKRRIESPSREYCVPVGLVLGPSGCGKSSLFKAGLLPRLEPRVIKVYLEATQDTTEQQLLGMLRDRLAEIPINLGLTDVLENLRYHRWLRSGEKVLIVIDQFEQWLYSHRSGFEGELLNALRQCDGRRVQAILMVRDDYWTPIRDFLKALEINLAEEKNFRQVGLFNLNHARKVLTLFGQAFDQLPHDPRAITRDQNKFLDAAVATLDEDQDHKIVSVRLSMFARMLEGRSWVPNTLEALNGVGGVGVAFLRESFEAPGASPLRKQHVEAAQQVLSSLLPPLGMEIKRHCRTTEELAVAAGYSNRPDDHAALLKILDDELRLITPAFNENQQTVGYQLTHDYLVPSLRYWLEEKLPETRRGRALLRLKERAATWEAKKENRQLPSLAEYVRIATLTRRRLWTEPQRRMMRRARRHLATVWGTMAMAATLTIFGALCFYRLQQRKAEINEVRGAVDALQIAPAPAVAYAIKDLQRLNPQFAIAELERRFGTESANGSEEAHFALGIRRLRLAQALASYGRADVDYLVASIAWADSAECDNLATALKTAPREKWEKKLLLAMEVADGAGVASKSWKHKALLAMVGLHAGAPAVAIDLHRLRDRPDPTQQTQFIHDFFVEGHGDLNRLVQEAKAWEDAGLLYGLSLSLGKVPKRDFSDSWLAWRDLVMGWHRQHPDSGVHSASAWALRQWGESLPDLSEPSRRDPPAYQNWWPHELGFTMLRIPGGQFQQADDMNPRVKRKVRLRDYWISDREVTVGLYQRFLDDPSEPAKPISPLDVDKRVSPTADHPLQNVSWFDAVLFCNWLSRREGRKPCYVCVRNEAASVDGGWEVSVDPGGNGYRLLTEAEWEYGCRAGTETVFCFGDSVESLTHYATFRGYNENFETTPAYRRVSNRYGVFDMHGNVWEWCRDWSGELPAGDVADPVGPSEGSRRALRSGCWDDGVAGCRSAFRGGLDPRSRTLGLGFRIALSLVGAPAESVQDKKK